MAVKVAKAVDFPGEATVTLIGLPNKVTTDVKKITKDTTDLVVPHQDRQGFAGRQSRQPVLPGGDHPERRADRAQHRHRSACGSTCRCLPRPAHRHLRRWRRRPSPRRPRPPSRCRGSKSSGWKANKPRPANEVKNEGTATGIDALESSLSEGLPRNDTCVVLDLPRWSLLSAGPWPLPARSWPATASCRDLPAQVFAPAKMAPLASVAVFPVGDQSHDGARPPVDRRPGDLCRWDHARRDQGSDAQPGRPQARAARRGRLLSRGRRRHHAVGQLRRQDGRRAGQGRAGDGRRRRSASGST